MKEFLDSCGTIFLCVTGAEALYADRRDEPRLATRSAAAADARTPG
jgi:hypothetical protein